jgi:subtilisin family serine protease
VRLPPSQVAAGMSGLRSLLGRHGAQVKNAYSARVGLDDTLHLRATTEGLAAMRAEWPGLFFQRAVMRYPSNLSCGDGSCASDEDERPDRTTTCSLDCGVPPPRQERDELLNSPQVAAVGALASWGRTRGDKVRVCVLDTGYDAGPSSMHSDRPLKLEGGYSLPDDSPDFKASNLHGTHVAGILAARANGSGMAGVAPEVTLRAYNVFSVRDGRLGATDGDIIAGIDRALADGCQIVNMSFGGGYDSSLEHAALARAYAQGVLLVAASGNAEDASHGQVRTAAYAYPAAYPEVLAVGALSPDDVIASFSSTGPALQLSAPGVAVYSSVPVETGDRLASVSCDLPGRGSVSFAASAPLGGSGTPLNGMPLADCGFGSASDAASCAQAVAGRVALVERGPTATGTTAVPFVDKIRNVRARGAVGVILYNHRSGPAAQAGALLVDIDIGGGLPIPVLTLAAGDGEFLADRLRSREEIRCTASAKASDWAVLDGTSMAAPVVSGVAALLLSAQPTLSNVALRQVLIESAVDLGAPGRDDAYGFGRVDAVRALAQGSPRVVCGDGRVDPNSEMCDGPEVDDASCELLGFDALAGSAVVCNATCSGLDVSGCKCLPGHAPFDVKLRLLRNYLRSPITGTLAFYEVSLEGQPVRGAYARLQLARSGQVVREGLLGPSGANGSITHWLPETGNALPAGEYEVSGVITKAAGRCHDDQPIPPFRINIKS